ncbi:Na+/H+ antiporter NhaA [Sphingobium sp. SCG-1]|uniref:Na+/H+ antiporter NhaA n=1 Tax=Sphingobium sp. SCG-1 TaxID=2072936 RepID=UPI000CD6B773|nr:Na+/H+ antiporter NhaA [Sphingobium sp. SCG-1]AUW59066.1 Na+/H+ antiporter NhaA [Sphingobium sp. SCG-1]
MEQSLSHKSALRAFLTSEAGGGVLLILAAAMAMIAANASESAAHLYQHFIHAEIGPTLSSKLGPMTTHLWVNDGLMALFFLLVGLEIKREFLDGRLATWSARSLPMIAAAAGMAVPAIIYLVAAEGNADLFNGWAIPAATDIAFAIGVLALLGSRAPTSLKLFLMTVAIVDDMGAVAIIAIAYTQGINVIALIAAAAVLAVMFILNRTGVKALPIYLLCFAALWYAVLLSGVHATIAGVLAAFMIPIRATPGAPDAIDSPLHRLEHALHPLSAYVVVPLFGFVNAGVSLTDIGISQIFAPLPLGIAAGLFLGKQTGIYFSVMFAVKLGFGTKPRGATWLQIYGVALLCGIGFTMSLFIGSLAFPDAPLQVEEAKIGILMGSILSALTGFAVLRFAPLHPDHAREEAEQDSEIETDGDVARC